MVINISTMVDQPIIEGSREDLPKVIVMHTKVCIHGRSNMRHESIRTRPNEETHGTRQRIILKRS
jgi:hypothetical protein